MRLGGALFGLVLLACLGLWLVGVRNVDAGAEALPTESGMPYDVFGRVLALRVHAGRVDYTGLASDDEELRRFAATLAEHGPETTPALFPSQADREAWAINAYNASVLLGVLEVWPTRSVHDVSGPLELRPGFGFFYALRFALDGRRQNLYDFENDVVREFGDARVHAAIVCASASCPTLTSEPYLPETLEAQLDAAARAFASEPRHVHITPEAIELSAVYDWFADDFRAHARQLGAGDEVLDWVAHYATPEVARALAAARLAGLPVSYADYDWALNGR
ncbi:MAG: DUF547 domain-containing protein [Deltaproteobacteria bacterium]|nr:DUF547 domain-containing protein [Deltaproteobacteria bacterium]